MILVLSDEERKKRKREYDRKYREENPEKVRERNRRWKEANPELLQSYRTKWNRKNPSALTEKMTIYQIGFSVCQPIQKQMQKNSFAL